MANVKTFISNNGEVYTGTQADLMKTKDIKSRKAFDRPSGAPDASGDRWVTEEQFIEQGGIRKQTLFLGDRKVYGFKMMRDGSKKNTTWLEGVGTIAINYKHAKKCIRGDVEGFNTDYTADMQELVRKVETQYDVIDNALDDSPYAQEIKMLNKAPSTEAVRERRNKLEELNARWTRDKLDQAEIKSTMNKQGTSDVSACSDKELRGIAAMNGKLTEFLAGTWHPEMLY